MKYLIIIFLAFSGQAVFSQSNTFPTTGNVGIGVANPADKLEILGDVLWSGYRSGNLQSAKIGHSGGNYGGIGYNIDFTTTTGLFNRPLLDFSSYMEFTQGGFKFFGINNFSTASNINLLGGGQNLNLYAIITKDGNMGIGTATPAEKLAVNGNIRAKEIKVETSNWPDYVFNVDYQLPSLAETEIAIKNTGHLPGIPSASEVKANGVELGEMNAKLLQKIEELTLHLIEKDKQIFTQDARLKRVEELLKKLKLQ